MLLDANVLIYSVDRTSPHNQHAAAWVEGAFNGDQRIGIPWQTIGAFLRLVTHPRASRKPLSGPAAHSLIEAWFDTGLAWVPPATERTLSVLGTLIERLHLTANLIPDAQLAALAIEHGLTVVSADTDFARFGELRWINPLDS